MIPGRKETSRDRPAIEVATGVPPNPGAAVLLKRTIQFGALLWVLPRLLFYRISRVLWGRERAFLAASESIARIPGHRGVYCRQAFYRRTLRSCGRDVYLGWLSTFSKSRASIGEGAYIGRRCGVGLVDIGANVMLADGVQLLSGRHQHDLTAPPGGSYKEGSQNLERIEIGDGAWLGTNAVIMADVGEGAVVGAGAVVVEPVAARTLAVGIPARVIKQLPPS